MSVSRPRLLSSHALIFLWLLWNVASAWHVTPSWSTSTRRRITTTLRPATSPDNDTQVKPAVKGISVKIAVDSQGGVADLAAARSDRFTAPASLDRVHRLRRAAQAVLVGKGTVNFDDPSLTIRRGVAVQRQPLRVVLDSQLSLLQQRVEQGRMWKLFEDGQSTTVVYHAVTDVDEESLNLFENMHLVRVPTVPTSTRNEQGLDVEAVWKDLQERWKVSHLMVEGGPTTVQSFLQAGLVDRVILVRAVGITFRQPIPGNLDDLEAFGLEKLGSFDEQGDTTECWVRIGEQWPTAVLSDWP